MYYSLYYFIYNQTTPSDHASTVACTSNAERSCAMCTTVIEAAKSKGRLATLASDLVHKIGTPIGLQLETQVLFQAIIDTVLEASSG